MVDAVEGVFNEVTSGVDPMELPLVEVPVGFRLEFLFLSCLEDFMIRFYLLK